MDRVHGPGPSKYGPGPWTPSFTTPKITEVNKNKIKSKISKLKKKSELTVTFQININ